jgi:hypothetical protein
MEITGKTALATGANRGLGAVERRRATSHRRPSWSAGTTALG